MVIAAADVIVRAGYTHVLETAGAGFVVVAQVDSADALLDAAAAHRPGVAMVDLSLPPAGGLDATRRLRERHPATGILVFCIAADSDLAMRSFDAGALGYITRDSDAAAIAQAVRNVAQGKPYLKQEMMHGGGAAPGGRPARHQWRRCRRASSRCSACSPKASRCRRSPTRST